MREKDEREAEKVKSNGKKSKEGKKEKEKRGSSRKSTEGQRRTPSKESMTIGMDEDERLAVLVKRARPRPMSEQLLGHGCPKCYEGDDGRFFFNVVNWLQTLIVPPSCRCLVDPRRCHE